MTIFNLFLVAALQGLTEFLPVSSSGHLILLSRLSGLQDQGLFIDVAVHVGTLCAVILYFRHEVRLCLTGVPRLLRGHIDTAGAKLAFLLIIATVPVIVLGLILAKTGWVDQFRSMTLIGWTMLIFGLVLYWADRRSASYKTDAQWNTRDAITMGFWQAIALIPGTSRSGIVITAARHLGYQRTDAARLSMLMSIPTIAASGILLGIDAAATADLTALRDGAIAALFAFAAGLVALSIMMRLLRTVSFTPYVIYRVALGLLLLGLAYS